MTACTLGGSAGDDTTRRGSDETAAGELDEEQRTAFCLVDELLDHRVVCTAAEQFVRQDDRIRDVEPCEGDFGHSVDGSQSGDQRTQRTGIVHSVLACGADHKQWDVWCEPQREMQELERLRVAPLQVVHDQHERTTRSGQRPGQRLEQTTPLIHLVTSRDRKRRPLREELRYDSADLAQPDVVEHSE